MNHSDGSGIGLRGVTTIVLVCAFVWGLNLVWLWQDTRPPVWDMALHQLYALRYLQAPPGMPWFSLTGNYPPFVHWMIALCERIFHPGPHIAILANIPATLLLFWAIYALGLELAGARAACWACVFLALTPYVIWISRETVLDYWLAAWVAAALVVLRRTEGFRSHSRSLLFGLIVGLGLLTKWFFAAFIFFPCLQAGVKYRIWRDRTRMLHLADAALSAGLVAGIWYLPNVANLKEYFFENAKVGALEGEPQVLSFQSFIYYLRLLEGYQLFALLFAIVALSVFFVWRKRLLHDAGFLAAAVCGGWLAMTLLRTKDPRFTLPLLGPLLIVPAAWLQSWRAGWRSRAVEAVLVSALVFQAYAANFGIRWLPEELVLARGYQGSFEWNWNVYLQHYFHILGAPRREDWKLDEILSKVADEGRSRGTAQKLALIPDLPRFNAASFTLMARLRGYPVQVGHLRVEPGGIQAFDGYDYVIMTERDQGMSWTTRSSQLLNQTIVDAPRTFRLLGCYVLPSGDTARLYFIQRDHAEVRQ